MKLLNACLKTLKLSLIFYVGATGAFLCFTWFHVLLAIVAGLSLNDWEFFILYGVISLATLLCGLVWFLLLNGLYLLLLRLLWAKPPTWIRITQGRRDTVVSFLIGAVSCLPVTALALRSLSHRYGGTEVLIRELAAGRDEGAMTATVTLHYWWIWFLVAIALYFCLESLSQWFSSHHYKRNGPPDRPILGETRPE